MSLIKLSCTLISSILVMAPLCQATASETKSITALSHKQDTSALQHEKLAAHLKSEDSKLASLWPPMSTLSASALRRMQIRSFGAAKQSNFNALTVAPPVAGCYDIDLGLAYNAPTAPAGQADCFQFISSDATKIVAYVVNLPSGEQHDVYLVQVAEDGSWIPLDHQVGVASNKIVEAIPGGPVRILLLVDAQQGVGGSTFQFQVSASTGYDSFEPNDSILHPTLLVGNQYINANLDTASDFDYYSIQIPASQTVSSITFNGTGTQTAELETSPNNWMTLTPGTNYNVTTSAGATIMLRAYDTGAPASAPQPYALRVSDGNGLGGFYRFLDTENISHLAPGYENVARDITVGVTAWDHSGNTKLPPGEHITVQAYDTNIATGDITLLASVSGYTDASGNLLIPMNIGTCKGGGTLSGSYQTTSLPADHWQITYNPYSFAVAFLDNGATKSPTSFSYFTHVCNETYLGQY